MAADGVDLGQTEPDGSRVVATPAILKGSSSGSCTDECVPVVTVRSGDRALFLPAERGALGELGDFYGFDVRLGRAVLVHLQHRPDPVPAHGHGQRLGRRARSRDAARCPASVSVRLSTADPYRGDSQGAPLSSTEAKPNGIGAYSASVALDDLPEGDYVLESSVGGDVVGSTLVPGRPDPEARLSVGGHDRSPGLLPGRPGQGHGDGDVLRGITGRGRPAPARGPRREDVHDGRQRDGHHTDDDPRRAPTTGPANRRSRTINVSPARAEEGQITGDSREIVAFPSPWTVDATTVGRRRPREGDRQRARGRS